MKAICIAGNSQIHTEEVMSNLLRSGIAPALPSKRDHDINIHVWHDQAIGVRTEKSKSLKIGKLWEQMAVDIFLANHKQEVWCWSHKDSLKIAEYWLAFDSGIHFLLVYTPYEDYVSELISADTVSKDAISNTLETWQYMSQALLDLHEAHPDRTTIISSHAQLNEFVLSLNADLKTHLRLDTEWNSTRTGDRIFKHLVRNYAHAQPAIIDIEKKASRYLDESNTDDKLYEVIASYLNTKQTQASPVVLASQEDMSSTDVGINDQADHISELESEIDLLLAQLHAVQESYDDHLNVSTGLQKNYEVAKSRLDTLLDKHPDYWEAESVITEYYPHTQCLQWRISNTYLKDSRFEKLEFQTNATEDGVTLIFSKPTEGKPLLSRWPYPNGKEITISHPNNNPEQVAALNSLGVSDWEILNFLITRILGYLKAKSAPKEIKTNFKNKIITGVGRLQQELENWPLLLRYDSVELMDTLHIGEYQALGITLTNLQLGTFKIPSFSFRLATFNEAGQQFGAHPRLEFPESCKRALTSWFPESMDERGARLELRFSQPNQMDTNIWARFSSSEQIFIAALIANLKTQLYFIKQNNPKLAINWAEWGDVISFMKLTLSKAYASRNH